MRSIADPAAILERVPELFQFATDHKVRAAIEKGDPHALYRTLWWGRRLGRLDHRGLLDEILAQRRLFVKPARRSPALATLNGFGARVYGRSEPQTDGTYVTTHFLVAVFLPVVPLAQYLVSDATSATGSKSGWYFLGKVPMSWWLRTWNRVVMLGVLTALGLSGAHALHSARYQNVYVVNPLPAPVRVAIGPVELEVAAGKRRSLEVPAGMQPVKVTGPGGRVVETGSLTVEAGPDLCAWNVKGLAPIFAETVLYGDQRDVESYRQPEPEIYCQQTSIKARGIDFAFRDPPREIQMPKNQKVARRKHLGVADGGWLVCVGLLAQKGEVNEALAATLTITDMVEPDISTLSVAAKLYLQAGRADDGLALLRDVVTKHPDSVEHHRLYQSFAQELGLGEELRATYRARLDASPRSPDALYLYARVLPPREGLDLISPELAAFPDHVPLHRCVAYNAFHLHDYERALGSLERLRALADEEWGQAHLEAHVNVLAALDRLDEARSLLETGYRRAKGAARLRMATIDAWLADRSRGTKKGGLVEMMSMSVHHKLEFGIRAWRTGKDASLVGIKDSPDRSMLELVQLAHYQPWKALDATLGVAAEDLESLDRTVLVLLLGEAIRTDHAAAEPLATAATALEIDVDPLSTYLMTGEWRNELDDLVPMEQGALHVVRARLGTVDGPVREALRERAAGCDPVGGFVRKALDDWPEP